MTNEIIQSASDAIFVVESCSLMPCQVWRFLPDGYKSFVMNIVTTMFGSLFAFLLALRHERNERKKETLLADRLNEMNEKTVLRQIKSELLENIALLETRVRINDGPITSAPSQSFLLGLHAEVNVAGIRRPITDATVLYSVARAYNSWLDINRLEHINYQETAGSGVVSNIQDALIKLYEIAEHATKNAIRNIDNKLEPKI